MKKETSSIDIDRLAAIVQASSNALAVQESKNESLKAARRSLVTANAAVDSLEQHYRSTTGGVPPDLTAAREAARRCRLAIAAAEHDHKLARDHASGARKIELACRDYAGRQRITIPDESGRNLPRELTRSF